jgi:hypothetical protein
VNHDALNHGKSHFRRQVSACSRQAESSMK